MELFRGRICTFDSLINQGESNCHGSINICFYLDLNIVRVEDGFTPCSKTHKNFAR